MITQITAHSSTTEPNPPDSVDLHLNYFLFYFFKFTGVVFEFNWLVCLQLASILLHRWHLKLSATKCLLVQRWGRYTVIALYFQTTWLIAKSIWLEYTHTHTYGSRLLEKSEEGQACLKCNDANFIHSFIHSSFLCSFFHSLFCSNPSFLSCLLFSVFLAFFSLSLF